MGLSVTSTTADVTSGEITSGQTLLITVVYSGNTTITGTPRISLSNGAFATYTSGSASTNIVFRYIVGASDTATTDINAGGPTAIQLNSGTIRDSGGGTNNNALGTQALRSLGGTVAVNVSCFVKGTRIASEAGEVAVEHLQIGDCVMTLENGAKRIKWIGRTTYEAEIVSSSPYVRPVIVRAGALGDGVPTRDLHLSPQHALYLDGVLVPVVGLVNGASIQRDMSGAAIEYFHVELEDHDVILAEGAAVETYIDTDTRAMFDNASEFDRLYGAAKAEMAECAPRVEEGYLLAAMRKRFATAAGVSTPTATQGRLVGNVEAVADGFLVGWAQDADNVDSPVEVEVLVDGETIGRALANRYRGDLFSAGLGNGSCCYSLAVPASVTSIDQVTVRRVADGQVIVPHAKVGAAV